MKNKSNVVDFKNYKRKARTPNTKNKPTVDVKWFKWQIDIAKSMGHSVEDLPVYGKE